MYTGPDAGANGQDLALPEVHDDEFAVLSALALRAEAHWGYPTAVLDSMRAELTRTPEDRAQGVFRLATIAGVVAGFHAVIDHAPGVDELEALFLDPPWIGHGVGRCLLAVAVSLARSRGAARSLIQSGPNAERFYRAAGAVPIGSRPAASVPGRSLPLLVLDLQDRAGTPALRGPDRGG